MFDRVHLCNVGQNRLRFRSRSTESTRSEPDSLGDPRFPWLRSLTVATSLPKDLQLKPLDGDARDLADWLTTFHMASVVLDPFTNESSWILKTAVRILEEFRDADVRVNFVVTANAADTRRFMGPLTERFLVFTDPDRTLVKAAGFETLPAFAFIRVDGVMAASAEGWNAAEWRTVSDEICAFTTWRPPTIPTVDDPGPFVGSPALG